MEVAVKNTRMELTTVNVSLPPPKSIDAECMARHTSHLFENERSIRWSMNTPRQQTQQGLIRTEQTNKF